MEQRNTAQGFWQDRQAPFGIAAGIPVATPDGWIALDRLAPGDRLLTLGSPEPQPITSLAALQPGPACAREAWPVHLPAGMFGNRAEVDLLPGQPLLLYSDSAEDAFGSPESLVQAQSLIHWRGAAQRMPEGGFFMAPKLARPALIYAGPGLILACEGLALPLAALVADPGLPILSAAQGRALVACLIAEDMGAALRAHAAF